MAITSVKTVAIFEYKCENCGKTKKFEIGVEHKYGILGNAGGLDSEVRERIKNIEESKEIPEEIQKCSECGHIQSFAWFQKSDIPFFGEGCLAAIVVCAVLSLSFAKLFKGVFNAQQWIGVLIGIVLSLVLFFIYSKKIGAKATNDNFKKYAPVLIKKGLFITDKGLEELKKISSKKIAEKLIPLKGKVFKTEEEFIQALKTLEDGEDLYSSHYNKILYCALKGNHPVFIKLRHPYDR